MKQSRRIKRRSRNRNSRKLRKLRKIIRGGKLLFLQIVFNNAIEAAIDNENYEELDKLLKQFSNRTQLRGYVTKALKEVVNKDKLMIGVELGAVESTKYNDSKLFLTILKRDAELNGGTTNYNPFRLNINESTYLPSNLELAYIKGLLPELDPPKEEMQV